VTRFTLCTVVIIALAVTASVARAAESDRFADPQWPAVEGSDAQWPNLRAEDLPSSRPNPRPAFIDRDQVPANEASTKLAIHAPALAAEIFKQDSKASANQTANQTASQITKPTSAAMTKAEVTGSTAQWPKLSDDEPRPSPFAFE